MARRGVVGDQRARHPAAPRAPAASSAADALGAGAVEQVLAVDVQHVEEQRRERRVASARRAPKRLAVTWNGSGRPSGRSAIASPSSTAVARRQRERRLDDLGHARGDVVEAAREDAHLVAAAVDLHARAVELPLDRRRAGPLERRVDVVAAARRASAASGGRPRSPTARERLARRSVSAARRHGAEVAAQHQRAPHRVARHARPPARPPRPSRPPSAPWRSSPSSSATRKRCSGSVARANSSASAVAARRLRARPAQRADAPRTPRRPRRASSVGSRGRRAAGRAATPSRRRSGAGAARPTGRRRRSPTSSGSIRAQRLGQARDLLRARGGRARRPAEVAASSASSIGQSWQAAVRAPTRQLMFERRWLS